MIPLYSKLVNSVILFLYSRLCRGMKRFGEKIRTLREQHGLSYRKMASRLETSHSHIINLESGKHKPSVDLIVRIAQAFDVSFDQLMDDDIDIE